MTLLPLLITALSVIPLFGQLEVYTVKGTDEQPVTALIAMGATATGEPLDVAIRIRNKGTTLANITTLSIQGAGFSLLRAPTGTVSLVAGMSFDFFVRFVSERSVGDARANLRINTATISLLASAAAAPALLLVEEDGSRTRKLAGEPSVFLNVERGARSTRRFVLENPQDSTVTITAFAVTGDSFQSAEPVAVPFQLNPGQSRTFDVIFQPATTGLKTGAILIDQRRYPLEGVGREPVLPKPILSANDDIRLSGKQAKLSVRFDAVSHGDGAGRIRVEFTPSVEGPDEPGVLFSSTNSRTVAFSIRQGESEALFGSAREVVLQTGTTAGTLKLTVEMGGFTTETTYLIAAAPVVMDTLTARLGFGLLEVTLKGFDNTRSATEVAFTFFDRNGQMIQPGEFRLDVADRFRRYFETTTVGGMFSIQAGFEANGATVSIGAAEVEMRNRAGITRTQRLEF